MRPWLPDAAMFVAQWQADDTSQARPASNDSKAPRTTSGGALSVSWMLADQPSARRTRNSYSSPSSVK
jgi:hypothetical protein